MDDSKPPQDAPRKVRFMPKAPPRRVLKAQVKNEKVEENVDPVQAEKLMKQFQERSNKPKPKDEKKVNTRVAFGFGATSESLKSYGPRSGSAGSRDQYPFNGSDPAPGLREKEYIEPWDYYSYYPVSLPMRRPYSGNPAILDEEEFGEASETVTYDENSTNHAVGLGLMEEDVEARMLFLQLPPTVPVIKRSASADSREVKENARPSARASAVEKTCRLNELPAGYMGKMLVYKSGAVKLRLGDTLYDVSPGMDCICAQDVVAINTEEKDYCIVAEIGKRAVITPDVDAVLSTLTEL